MVTSIAQLGRSRPVALVTGGARRVGAEVCQTLAAANMDILFTFQHSSDEAATLTAELSSLDITACALPLDLANPSQVDSFCDELTQELPRLDALVHNAAMYEPSPIADLTPEDLARHFQINALAPAILSARLAPMLRHSDSPAGGSIVAMCDIHAMGRPRRNFLAYSMSKAALAEMVRSLARQLAPDIRVNGVAPGVVAFPDSGFESDPALQERYLSRVPLKRAGTPTDAAEVVRWLTLDAAYVTGEIIRLDGGRWLT